MCTIITVERNSVSDDELIERMQADAVYNSDGFSLLLITASGESLCLRSEVLSPITDLVSSVNWVRCFFHARAATQGRSKLSNTHGWNTGDVYVFHNGILRHEAASDMTVDSMLINKWVEFLGIEKTLDQLVDEPYANVMLVDLFSRMFHIHRSETGSLYSDGNGNYSTNAVGNVFIPVETYYQCSYKLPAIVRPISAKVFSALDYMERLDRDDVDDFQGYEDIYFNSWASVKK